MTEKPEYIPVLNRQLQDSKTRTLKKNRHN